MSSALAPPTAPPADPPAAQDATPPAELPAGRHRSGATESGPTSHQWVCVAGVLALAGVLAILVMGALARFDADGTRAEAQSESSHLGGQLVSMRAETHDTHMLTARYFEAWRAYVEASRRYGAASAVSADADAASGAALAEATRRGERQEALAEADGPLRDLEAARIALADARARLDPIWTALSNAGVVPAPPQTLPGKGADASTSGANTP